MSIYQAGASVLGSVIDSISTHAAISKQNEYNKELAEYQNQWNLEMWNRQNEYNSPIATMKRLTDAGINPRAYQELGKFANADTPKEAAKYEKISELSAYQGVVRNSLENAFLKAQIEKENAETQNVKEDTSLKSSQSGYYQSMTSKAEAEVEKIKADTSLSQVQKDKVMSETINNWYRTIVTAWSYGTDFTNERPLSSISGGIYDHINNSSKHYAWNKFKHMEQKMKFTELRIKQFEKQDLSWRYNFMMNNGRTISTISDAQFNRQLNLQEYSANKQYEIGSYNAQKNYELGVYNAKLNKAKTDKYIQSMHEKYKWFGVEYGKTFPF